MEQSIDVRSSSRSLSEQSLYTLVSLPIELLVYIFSFVNSARDKAKLRYVSQRLLQAVEAPSLWRNFTWPHYDFREERSIESVFKSCGRHMKQLSFPDTTVLSVESLQHCSNVLRLSLPSVKLNFIQLRRVMQCMKKLQYLDVLWTTRNDIKSLLLIVAYPVYGYAIKELTIREKVKDSSFGEALHFLLNEWTALRLFPHTLNVVTNVSPDIMTEVVEQWMHFGKPRSVDRISYLNIYGSFSTFIGLVSKLPILQYQIFGSQCGIRSFINARNYGLLGLDSDYLLLTSCTISNGDLLHKANLSNSSIQGTPLNITSIEFLTHFVATQCGFLYSEHLEQLAIVCPNLQQLNLMETSNCLKCLRGLRAIATCCQKLEGLNIMGISVKEVESCIELWKILVDLHLTYLAIELCCLLCFEDDQTKQIITSLHQKCLKVKALESSSYGDCTECVVNELPLMLSNFPLLIHCCTWFMKNVNICETLRYLCYIGDDDMWWPWSIKNCNLEQLCTFTETLVLPDSFMNAISAHGGLVHVILNVDFVTQTGIAALIENSPNLITCHVYIQNEAAWHIFFSSGDFRSRLVEKYSQRKLFLCGSCCLVKGGWTVNETRDYLVHGNMDVFSLWNC